ncbi:DNA mismatch repair protein MutL [Anaerobacterium chartisolvens]|uniref:DNA mismatch repair protein MutL n=1 Tax=Anaerobacterium chartisolvens TaxID=1297424 RepID=A0A369ALU2_9FIRM|nr:DNA mismatch repair endonuclease MutL [Anaerobacterium chartisolvens]RCX10359.1 DNA mismatch repair protein MutL [Anaerobacterium chartisolvens]
MLDEGTANKIAAGEVVERPASVVKELVENSIDAGASSVSVEIKNGGITFIRVSDNGSGIEEDDAEIAFERHATSKIRSSGDLEAIATLGFRGEALASIASVSSVELITRVRKNPHGICVKIQGGSVMEIKETGCAVGTVFTVRDLFYNTPARFKFLKKDSTEAGYISDMVSRIALARPHISMRLISNGATVLHTPGNNDLLSAIFSIYGKDIARQTLKIDYEDERVRIEGYAGKPEIARSTRNYQSIFINGRYIKSKLVSSAIDEAYKTFLMKNKFPFAAINIKINPLLVDVNVHPAKMEIRFSEEKEIFRSIFHAVSDALAAKSLVKEAHVGYDVKDSGTIDNSSAPGFKYVQQRIDAVPYNTPQKYKSFEAESTKHAMPEITSESNKDKYIPQVGEEEPQREEPQYQDVQYESKASGEFCGIAEAYDEAEENDAERLETDAARLARDAVIIGQAFNTYIILELYNELIILDQHAAHERIMYEGLRRKYINRDAICQQLISPVVIELTNQEIKFLEETAEFLESLGFIYESFGNNTIMLRSIPYGDIGISAKEAFIEVLDKIISSAGSGLDKNSYGAAAEEALYTIACKAAVKANKRLDSAEIRSLLEDLAKLDNPYTCPHGRPTIVKLTKHELEKMFKRIV